MLIYKVKIKIFFSIGIILVYDLTNLKSSENLHKWLTEILNKDNNSKYKYTEGFDMEQLVGSNRVIIIILFLSLTGIKFYSNF